MLLSCGRNARGLIILKSTKFLYDLQDTPDLLRQLEDLKKTPLPSNTLPVSIDVVGLYSNIPHDEAIKSMTDALNSRKDQTIPTLFLITLMMQVLSYNVFAFGTLLFVQIIGIAMGTRSAPTIANIFMNVIDGMIRNTARLQRQGFDPILFFKRFIDDILIFWTGTVKELEDFIIAINQLHPTIKFTANYDILTKSTTLLDTTITIKDGYIITDIYIGQSSILENISNVHNRRQNSININIPARNRNLHRVLHKNDLKVPGFKNIRKIFAILQLINNQKRV